MKKLITLLMLLLTVTLTGCADYDDKEIVNPPEPVDVKLSTTEYAAHGTKSFNVTAVTMADGVVEGVKIDEYAFWQYASYNNVVCVPNGDNVEGLGQYYDGSTQCLGSKRANSDEYSAKMAEIAGATKTWLESIKAIEDYAVGKTLEELKGFNSETDTIAGSTLIDTNNYLQSVIAAIEATE
ncbi:hypothetical protein RJG79_04210 [Mycoplasmatota bacterium WC44]